MSVVLTGLSLVYNFEGPVETLCIHQQVEHTDIELSTDHSKFKTLCMFLWFFTKNGHSPI